MENRKSEIENLVPSFVACLAPIITRYREMKDAQGAVKHFAERVEVERGRYQRKFASMRGNSDYAGLEDVINEVETQVMAHADLEISRARADGKVEFDSMTRAMRDTHEAMSNAVDKLEEK